MENCQIVQNLTISATIAGHIKFDPVLWSFGSVFV